MMKPLVHALPLAWAVCNSGTSVAGCHMEHDSTFSCTWWRMHMLSAADQVIVCIIHVPWNLHNDMERGRRQLSVSICSNLSKDYSNMIWKVGKYLSDLHTHPRNCYTERILSAVDEKTDQRHLVMWKIFFSSRNGKTRPKSDLLVWGCRPVGMYLSPYTAYKLKDMPFKHFTVGTWTIKVVL